MLMMQACVDHCSTFHSVNVKSDGWAQSPADVSAATSAEPVEEVEHRETADDFLEALRAPPAKEEAHH